jgi:acid phosphatase (class A)
MKHLAHWLVAGLIVTQLFGLARAEQLVPVPSVAAFADMLPLPPKPGSDQDKVELAVLMDIQAHRSAADIAHAQSDAATRNIFLFATLFGDGFNAKSLPATAALSGVVETAEKSDIEPVKFVYGRLRPFAVDKDLHPVCPVKKIDDSYPSGHTMTGYLEALTLASILPEKKDAILARADDFAHSRLVCGVHHQSDLAAGKLLAYALFPILEQDPRFQAARDAAQVELRKALKLRAAAE